MAYPNVNLFIDGKWRPSHSGKTITVLNPATEEPIGTVAHADKSDLDEALAAAEKGFKAWRAIAPFERAKVMRKAATLMRERADVIGPILTMEQGKTLAEATLEANLAADIIEWFAEEGKRAYGRIIPARGPGVYQLAIKEPVGPVAAFTPWNFPIAIPAWKIAPALCYGNTVVFKPAELVPGCAHALSEIIAKSGIPAGVFNLVVGSGSVVGQTLLEHPDVAAISFTGSVQTGRKIAQACVLSNPMKKFQLEMGGKNPLVVLDDADLKTAVEVAVNGAYFSTGQRCTASSRLIVTEGIHDRFVAAVAERLNSLSVDDALKAGVHIGPVVDQNQLDQDLRYIKIGQDEGAKLAFGGELLKRDNPGHYLQPALFTEANNNMRIAREEIFGPVAAVIRAKNYEEALAISNDTEFGLASGICTTSLKYASHYKRNSESGMVMVNLPTAGVDYHVPFGGRKGSSYGAREQGSYAREFYTTVKTAYTFPG